MLPAIMHSRMEGHIGPRRQVINTCKCLRSCVVPMLVCRAAAAAGTQLCNGMVELAQNWGFKALHVKWIIEPISPTYVVIPEQLPQRLY